MRNTTIEVIEIYQLSTGESNRTFLDVIAQSEPENPVDMLPSPLDMPPLYLILMLIVREW